MLRTKPSLKKEHSAAPRLLLDDQALRRTLFQPMSGLVEVFLAFVFSPKVLAVESVFSGLADYKVERVGTGAAAIEQLIRDVFEKKLHSPPAIPAKAWDRWVLLSLNGRLHSVGDQQETSTLRPSRLADIHPNLENWVGPGAVELCTDYAQSLKVNDDLGCPLYVTGEALCDLGANPFAVEEDSLWMLDGSKRMLAHALNHTEDIVVKVIMPETQYQRLLSEEDRASVRRQIEDLAWFSNYQAIPQVGLKGQRTSTRYQQMETTAFRGKRILDFGCNTGESCLRAAQIGASEVIGLDVMPDTLAAARATHDLFPLPNLHYHQINFNDHDFADQIDQMVPGQVDYSFFFSVYRTQELRDRDSLFLYVLNKSKLGVYFEGHGDPRIDSLDFYIRLFDRHGVSGVFLGYSENDRRPLFFIDRSNSAHPSLSTHLDASSSVSIPSTGDATARSHTHLLAMERTLASVAHSVQELS